VLLARADCTIAASLDEPSILQDGFYYCYEEGHPGIPRVTFNSPLVPPGSSFASLQVALGIHSATAWILDEVRMLIEAAYAMPSKPLPQELGRLQTAASRVHDGISRLPPSAPGCSSTGPSSDNETSGEGGAPEPLSLLPSYPDFTSSARSSASPPPAVPAVAAPSLELDPLYAAVRLAAMLYAKAVATLQPLGEVCSEADALSVLTASWRIPLARWRDMSGILVWIMVSILPTVHRRAGHAGISAKVHTRFAKSILQCGWMQMSLENWAACHGSMQRVLWFQRWLRKAARSDG